MYWRCTPWFDTIWNNHRNQASMPIASTYLFMQLLEVGSLSKFQECGAGLFTEALTLDMRSLELPHHRTGSWLPLTHLPIPSTTSPWWLPVYFPFQWAAVFGFHVYGCPTVFVFLEHHSAWPRAGITDVVAKGAIPTRPFCSTVPSCRFLKAIQGSIQT